MSLARDIGQLAFNVLRPDGGPVLNVPTPTSIPIGSARQIPIDITEGATINPADTSFFEEDPTQTPILSFDSISPPPGGPPYENVLEQFASYVPLWTMACLTPNQFNDPSTYRGNPSALSNVVFASAGRFDDQRVSTENGSPEYFIDNVVLQTKLAPSPAVGNTNVTGFSFTIFEPYSMGLFLQSLQAAAINAGYPTYLNDCPYLLKLEFLGFKDNGAIFTATEQLAKYFTIKITKVNFKVNEGGSTYEITAVPLHHTGFSDLVNRITNPVTITGDTVKEVLVSGQRSLCSALNSAQLQLQNKGQLQVPDLYEIVFPVDDADDIGLGSSSLQSVDILKATADPKAKINYPETDRKGQQSEDFGNGAIGRADMGFTASSGGNYLFKLESDVIDPKTGRVNRDQMSIDPKQRAFTFPALERVSEIIQRIILASQYGVDAVNPKKMVDGMVKWFRLDCQIQLLEYDALRNVRAKKYVYRVVPFKVHGSIFKNPSAQPAGLAKLNKVIAKRYDYLYTGRNNDLLKFELNFDGMFYTGQMPKPLTQNDKVSNTDTQASSDEKKQQAELQTGDAPSGTASASGSPVVKPDFNINTRSASGAKTVEQLVADSFQNAFLNSSKDLVNVTIDILGDPFYLSDSGLNSNYLAPSGPNDQVKADGSMNWEGSEIYCYIAFRNPVEPNLGTSGQGGLYNFPNGGSVSPFSGIYKVVDVENKFSGGTFQQTLSLIRVQGQPQDFIGREAIITDNQFLYDTTKPEPPKTSPNDDSDSYFYG